MLGKNITLQVYESKDKDIWRVFREHHYLTHDWNKACKLHLVYWGKTLVAMHSYLSYISGTSKYAYRGHRIVVLPDYQGLGIGTKLIDFFGEVFLSRGEKYFLKTTHSRFGEHMSKSPNWKPTSENRRGRGEARTKYDNENDVKYNPKYFNKESRLAFSFEYVGDKFDKIPTQRIVCIGDCDKDIATEYLNKIIDKDKYPVVITGIASIEQKTIWEEVAKEKGIRTEVLFIKSKGEYNINKSKLNGSFDAIVLSREGQIKLKPFTDNIKKCISINFKVEPNKNFINF